MHIASEREVVHPEQDKVSSAMDEETAEDILTAPGLQTRTSLMLALTVLMILHSTASSSSTSITLLASAVMR